MEPETAISLIETAKAEVEWNYPLDYSIAFSEGIKALSRNIMRSPKIDRGKTTCPICGSSCKPITVPEKYACSFCSVCGQKLFWNFNEVD